VWIIVIIHPSNSIPVTALWLQFFWRTNAPSKAEKAKTHERIASKKFREEGLAGIGIADLMKEAGLTVGGFYKHFKSHDDLVAEAVGSALGLWKSPAARSHAVLTYCALVGAIGVARAVSDEQLSREILRTVAELLKNPAS